MRRHSDSGVLPSSCARLTSCSSVAGFMPLGLLMYKSKTKMASSVVHCSAFISILLLNDGQIYFFSSESVALLFAILETAYLCTYIHVRRIDIYMKRKTKKGKGMMKTWLAVLVALGVCYVFGVYKQTGKVDVPAIPSLLQAGENAGGQPSRPSSGARACSRKAARKRFMACSITSPSTSVS